MVTKGSNPVLELHKFHTVDETFQDKDFKVTSLILTKYAPYVPTFRIEDVTKLSLPETLPLIDKVRFM